MNINLSKYFHRNKILLYKTFNENNISLNKYELYIAKYNFYYFLYLRLEYTFK